MTAPAKSLSLFHFFAGLLVGFLIGTSISRQWATISSRIIGGGVILAMAFFWRRIESYTHKRYMDTWAMRRLRGKSRFIVTHYVLIRGGVLFAAFVGPMFTRPPIMGEMMIFILSSLAACLALMVFLGRQSWTQCEREYEVMILRGAAQRIRTANN